MVVRRNRGLERMGTNLFYGKDLCFKYQWLMIYTVNAQMKVVIANRFSVYISNYIIE